MSLFDAAKAFLATMLGGRHSDEPYVIGTQMAAASAAQQRHEKAHGQLPSPVRHLSYSATECRLWRWSDSPVDSLIETKVATFAGLGDAERNSMRDRLSMDDFYTLLTFTRRCVLAALRNGDASKLEPAFAALAMIELERIDWRDLMMAKSMIGHAAQKLGAPFADLAAMAGKLAEPRTAEVLADKHSGRVNLAEACGLQEVDTTEGLALFDTSYARFEPRADLAGKAFQCALALEENGYAIDRLQLASDLPLVWLRGGDSSANKRLVERFTGCITIGGVPLTDPEPMSSGQSLLVFLAEVASESDALEIAAAADICTTSVTQIGLATGRLCAIIIQRSWMADTPPMEDKRSLERLREVFVKLLG